MRSVSLSVLVGSAVGLLTVGSVHGAGIVAWGNTTGNHTDFGQVSNTPADTDFVSIGAGGNFSTAIREDGSIFAWGEPIGAVPAGNDFVQVAGGGFHAIALRADGTAVGWGNNYYGQRNIPASPVGQHFAQVACGDYWSLYRRFTSLPAPNGGSVLGWGENDYGQATGYPGTHLGPMVDIDAGSYHGIALRADGTILTWGYNGHNQVTGRPLDAGYRAVAAGGDFCVAIRVDGSLTAWGLNNYGQLNVPAGNDFVDVSVSYNHSVALRRDGSLVAWGNPFMIGNGVPSGTNYSAISHGGHHCLALLKETAAAVRAGSTTVARINGGSRMLGGVDAGFSATGGGVVSAEYIVASDPQMIQLLIDAGIDPALLPDAVGANHQSWWMDYTGTFEAATLVFSYDPADLPPDVVEADLAVLHWNGAAWERLPSLVDPVWDTVTVETDSFSPFVLTVVPEPTTLALLAAGALALVRRRR